MLCSADAAKHGTASHVKNTHDDVDNRGPDLAILATRTYACLEVT